MTAFFKNIWLYVLARTPLVSIEEAKPTRFLWLNGQRREGFIPDSLPSHFISLQQAKKSNLWNYINSCQCKRTKVPNSCEMFYKQIWHSSRHLVFHQSSKAFYVIAWAPKVRCHAVKNITAAPHAGSSPRCTCTFNYSASVLLPASLDTQHLLHINL